MEAVNDHKSSLEQLSSDRKAELNGFISKNIYKFFFANSLLSFVFLGVTCLAFDMRFPVSKYLLFLAGYFILAIIVFRADFLVEAGNQKSEKRRYLALMLWHNLFFLVLGLSFTLFMVGNLMVLEVDDFIRIVFWVVLFFVLIFLFWRVPRRFSRDIYTGKRRSQAKFGYYFAFFSLVILLIRLILRRIPSHLEWIVLLFACLIGLILGFLISFQGIFQTWMDGLLIANDLLD